MVNNIIFRGGLMFITLLGCFTLLKQPSQSKISTITTIKLNGYYYSVQSSKTGLPTEKLAIRYFLFQDGKMMFAFWCPYTKLIESEKYFSSKEFVISLQDSSSYNWMRYTIKKDSIFFDRIYPQEGHPHIFFSGIILNDTTFLITKQQEKRAKIKKLNDTFYFKEFNIQNILK